MEVSLLDTLTVVTLWVGQAKEAFLEELVLFVPEREGNVLEAM